MSKAKKNLGNLLLPLLLGASIISSIIYDYQPGEVVRLTVISLIFEAGVFLLLDRLYKMKRKKIAAILCALTLIAALYVMGDLVRDGFYSSHIAFNNWFYFPTDSVDQYLYALIFGGGYLFYSALYYFTQVRYRALFTLFLIVFPFAIYAKRLDVMPARYLFAILFLYLLVMIHNRQTAADSGIVVMPNISYAVSILAFAAASVGLMFILPKPEIQSVQEKDASVFDNLSIFNNEAPSIISGMLNLSSREHGILPTGQELFYVNTSEEILYLKIQSYSYFENNGWYYGEDKIEKADYVWKYPEETVPGMAVTNKLAILEEYSRYKEDEKTLKLIEKMRGKLELSSMIAISQEDYEFKYLPLPEDTVSTRVGAFNSPFPANDDMENVYAVDGNIFCNGEWELRQPTNQFSAQYYPNETIREFASELGLTMQDWDDIMNWYYGYGSDYDIYDDANSDREHAKLVDSGEYDEYDSRIRDLALEITEGCESDYEKAAALERYFEDEGFVYDLEYIPDDESIEYFIFNSKRGICSDFATAMTLMARSVGLTARYCEGFVAYENASFDQVRNNNISSGVSLNRPQGGFGDKWYLVRDNYAHAFVEVYLPACGWVVFEPTVPSFTDVMMYIPRDSSRFSIMGMLGQAKLYIALGIMAITVVVIILLFRPISEAIFRAYVIRIERDRAIKKLYARIIKRLSRKTDTDLTAYTVNQACCFAQNFYMDISVLAVLFESSFYGGKEISQSDFANAFEQYKQAYAIRLKPLADNKKISPEAV